MASITHAGSHIKALVRRRLPKTIARQFLERLDKDAPSFTFQTFDDNKDRKDRNLARIFHGSLDECWSQLIDLNKQGAGVFVSVNETDRKRRRIANIVRVRAVLLDLDGEPLPDAWPLKPHMVLQTSPGRYHAYWLVNGLPLEQYKEVMWAVADKFGGDPQVAHVATLGRVPGFNHMKQPDNPHQSQTITRNNLPAYSAAQWLETYPPLTRAPEAPPSASMLVLSPKQPLKLAEAFIQEAYPLSDVSAEGVFGVRFYRGEFHIWQGNHYLDVEEQRIVSEIYAFLDTKVMKPGNKPDEPPTPFDPQMNDVRRVLHALKSGVFLEGKMDPPFWITEQQPTDTPPERLIAFQNGLLDVETRELLPHSPALCSVNVLPFAYDPKAAKPKRWFRFLRELWPDTSLDSKQTRLTLAEIMGYMLTHDTRQHKIFMLIGPPRSGKGTIERVLIKMLGTANVAGVLLRTLGSQFALQPLINKQVAIVSDARIDTHSDLSTITERLLSISGEDTLTVDRKYKEAWTGKLGARFLILTNEIPKFKDASGALAKRFVILTMSRSSYNQEDLQLDSKLEVELPGILNWALRGEERLRQRGYFIMPKASQEVLERLEVLASPVRGFVQDRCFLDPEERVSTKVLYIAWKIWCEEKGLKPGNEQTFGRDLHSAVLGLRTRQGTKERFYEGICRK